jgi:hypothetical protein
VTSQPPVIVRTYTGSTHELAAQQFAADAVRAADDGYVPGSQAWSGMVLTVTYVRRDAVPIQPEPSTAAEPSGEASGKSSDQPYAFMQTLQVFWRRTTPGFWLLVGVIPAIVLVGYYALEDAAMPSGIGPVDLLMLLFLSTWVLSPLAGFWIWHAKRQRRRWIGAVVGIAVGWLFLFFGWIVLVLIAILWHPAPEVDESRRPLPPAA